MIVIERTESFDTKKGVKVFKWVFDELSAEQVKSFNSLMETAEFHAENCSKANAINHLRAIINRYGMNALAAYRRLAFLLPEGKSRIDLLEPLLKPVQARIAAARADGKNCKFPSFPENLWFYDFLHLLAHSFFVDGQTLRGISLYEMMGRFSDDETSRYSEVLAWKYIEIGKYSKAIACSRAEYKSKEPFIELLYAFGLASVLNGDKENGFRALRKAYKIFPLFGQIMARQMPERISPYLEIGKDIESFGSYDLDHALYLLEVSYTGWRKLYDAEGRFPNSLGKEVFQCFAVND